MAAIVILVTTFLIAAVGIIQNNKASTQNRTLFGMTKVGFFLLIVASIGLVVSVVKQFYDSKDAAKIREQSEADTMLFKAMNAKLDFLVGETDDPIFKQQLKSLKDRMNLAASRSRQSNFSISDFSESRFDGAHFTRAAFSNAMFDDSYFGGASFARALMKGADFRGVDLSNILIDENTILPEKPQRP